MRRAQSSTRSPSGVKPWKREPRLTSSTPMCSSSCFMPGGQRRLGHAAGFGGAAEMLFPGQRQQEFELVDHVSPPDSILSGIQYIAHNIASNAYPLIEIFYRAMEGTDCPQFGMVSNQVWEHDR